MRVLGFSTNLSEIFILRELDEILTQMYKRLPDKYLLFLSDFNLN
jgi:hypothetical protein